MAKKKGAAAPTKASAKAAKKARTAQKVERKEKKKTAKSKADQEDDDEDLEGILDKVTRNIPAYNPILHHACGSRCVGNGKKLIR